MMQLEEFRGGNEWWLRDPRKGFPTHGVGRELPMGFHHFGRGCNPGAALGCGSRPRFLRLSVASGVSTLSFAMPRNMRADDGSDDGSEDECEYMLGFVEDAEPEALLRHRFASKVGGRPGQGQKLSEPGAVRAFMSQLGQKLSDPGAVRAFMSQLVFETLGQKLSDP
eukprot:gene16408-22618_t